MRSRKLPDYWNVQPLSLFTMDNAFKVSFLSFIVIKLLVIIIGYQ